MADDRVQPTTAALTPLLAGREAPLWPPVAQWSLALLAALGFTLIAYRGWGLTRFSTRPLPLQRAVLDLNAAEEIDLQMLPGIGPTLARRIVENRPYQSLEDLQRVAGIGPETQARLRPHLQVREPPAPMPPREPPPRLKEGAPVFNASVRKKPPEAIVQLNRATLEELQRLPGVGPTLAARIIAARPFARVDDLRRVKGVGPKTLDKLRPFVACNEP
ncbi:MAG: helix-hairpin-helix domain-containing protein [Gemmataceae bacterium]